MIKEMHAASISVFHFGTFKEIGKSEKIIAT